MGRINTTQRYHEVQKSTDPVVAEIQTDTRGKVSKAIDAVVTLGLDAAEKGVDVTYYTVGRINRMRKKRHQSYENGLKGQAL